jgi:hypothetical protein
MDLREVSNILWRERQVRDLLVFKLEARHRVMASGNSRWLAHATREVETVRAAVKRVELERTVLVSAAASDLGRDDVQSLDDFAGLVPSPWHTIFGDHQVALRELAAEAVAVTTTDRGLARCARAETAKSRNSVEPLTMRNNPDGVDDAGR